MKLPSLLPATIALSLLTSIASADPPGAPVSGHVSVYVTPQNSASYNTLAWQAQSLGARLASYNARASVRTSSPAVYRALVAEKQSLASEVSRYNAAASSLARQSPSARITIPTGRH
jgi:hypothetical protein